MIERIDPEQTGVWDITTYSGAVYRLRVPPDARATVVRRPGIGGSAPQRGLRRDHTPIEVVAWGSYDHLDGLTAGISLGRCVLFVLEPLGPDGEATVRVTTPVAGIAPRSQPDLGQSPN
ncbi:hypothetical protein ACFP63_00365 [Oerskovia jenensis]|uniref:Uncharacterized protein n=1 Tax=Oerskovia jenensis TaxID=162169 RepID=A0ABS2LEW2_9CELL|nr:hypothetical protein [Oerskovia jenensis]MBM7478959.1 hypothetical protein [Oerskovia jenensis]